MAPKNIGKNRARELSFDDISVVKGGTDFLNFQKWYSISIIYVGIRYYLDKFLEWNDEWLDFL